MAQVQKGKMPAKKPGGVGAALNSLKGGKMDPRMLAMLMKMRQGGGMPMPPQGGGMPMPPMARR